MRPVAFLDLTAGLLDKARAAGYDLGERWSERADSGLFWRIHPRDIDEVMTTLYPGYRGDEIKHLSGYPQIFRLHGLPVQPDESAVEGPILCDERTGLPAL